MFLKKEAPIWWFLGFTFASILIFLKLGVNATIEQVLLIALRYLDLHNTAIMICSEFQPVHISSAHTQLK